MPLPPPEPPTLNRRTTTLRLPRAPRWATVGAVVLTIAMIALDYGVFGGRFYAPFYYWLPIAWLGWFWGWQVATGLLALMAFIWILDQQALPNYWLLFSRLGVLLVGIGVARATEMLRLMREYYQRSSEWRGTIQPLQVGERLVLVPAQSGGAGVEAQVLGLKRIPVLLDPGTAFGTGSHPTTQMCLALLEKYLQPNDRVFDLGCGSGVLAIAAAKLGAGAVVAADIEAASEQATQANSQLNEVAQKIEFRRGSLETVHPRAALGAETFNLTLANILAHVLLELLPAGLGHTLAPGGTLILSGIRAEQAGELRQALTTAGLRVVEEQQREEWVALVAQPTSTPP